MDRTFSFRPREREAAHYQIALHRRQCPMIRARHEPRIRARPTPRIWVAPALRRVAVPRRRLSHGYLGHLCTTGQVAAGCRNGATSTSSRHGTRREDPAIRTMET
eukprot:1005588-Pyramimonas_sp.AAC.1